MADRRLTRRNLLALTGAGTAAGLAGCFGDGGGGGGDPAELPPAKFLTDYRNDQWQTKWEDELIPAFTEETDIGIDIEYSGFSGGGQESRLAQLIQAGDAPALSTGTFDQVADVWAADHLATVNDVIEQAESTAGELVSPPYRGNNGDIWQVSHGYYVSLFMYRSDIYEQLGLEPPESFEDVRANAQAIDESDLDIRGYGLAGAKTGKSQDEFQVYYANMGVSELRPIDPDAENPESELWFPKDEALTLLDFFTDLAQYSPDPSNIGWAQSIRDWLSGKYAQMYHLNFWPPGIAAVTAMASEGATADAMDAIASNTDVVPLPRWQEGGVSAEDVWLDNPTPDGHHLYAGADNSAGGREFMKWLYGDNLERTATMYDAEPTRFLPNYADVLDSDPFQNISVFQEYPRLLDRLQYIQNDIAENYYENVPEANVDTPESLYYIRFFFIGEMVNQVVVAGRDPEAAYDEARQKAQNRLQQGKERLR